MMVEKELEVADSVQGQFAATVTSVADLNGDELQDVAVGAPLEDDGRGAVYIYLGNWTQGIRSQYSQVHPKTATHGINPSQPRAGVELLLSGTEIWHKLAASLQGRVHVMGKW